MQNQSVVVNRRGRIGFADLEIEGTRECPRCHLPFIPHLGNLIADRFKCKRCKADLSYRSRSGEVVRCPCCNFFRPLPNSLTMLVCGGCQATVIYEKGDEAVKCCFCKHITTTSPTETDSGSLPPPPPRVNAETESTATSSITVPPKRENPNTIVADCLDAAADSIAQIVRDVALRIRETEEDKTEAESKKIRRH